MEFRILKKVLICLCGMALFSVLLPEIAVWANEREYPVSYKKNPDSEESYMVLEEAAEDYTVLPGDSLWKISRSLWGEGRLYRKLVDANRELFINPSLIYPGMSE